jgi:uncharacterized protein YqcC (DUF446 family)
MAARRDQEASRLLQDIEQELKRLGYWREESPPTDWFVDMGPFGGRTMTFFQWLQFVFIPAGHEVIGGRRPWPNSSHVGTYAVRELDGATEAEHLVSLLCEFDALAEPT